MNKRSRQLIAAALEEDLETTGDLTVQYFVPADQISVSHLISRERLIFSGEEVVREVLRLVDPTLEVNFHYHDGDTVPKGGFMAGIRGKTRSVLTAERTLLNFIQRLSAVATETYHYQSAVAHTKAKILDTRKTTPGWRELEKAAVRHGGGTNHRMGLYDAVMIKDNHLVADDRLDVLRTQMDRLKQDHPGVVIHIEADTLDQVRDFLALPQVDNILLDNMSLEELRQAVSLRDAADSRIKLEASGGITSETLVAVAETGVDHISVGALTHSVRSRDIGLDTSHIIDPAAR